MNTLPFFPETDVLRSAYNILKVIMQVQENKMCMVHTVLCLYLISYFPILAQ